MAAQKNIMDLVVVLASLFVVALPLVALSAVIGKRRDVEKDIRDLESRMKRRNQVTRGLTNGHAKD